MKKSIISLPLALLVVSLSASLALAAPQGNRTWPTGEDPTPATLEQQTGPMMSTDQMNERHKQMGAQHNTGMMKNMPCRQNRTTAK